MRKVLRTQEGFAYTMVLILIVVAGIIIAALMRLSTQNIRFSSFQRDRSRAYVTAQSGIQNLYALGLNNILNRTENDYIISPTELGEYKSGRAEYNVEYLGSEGTSFIFKSTGKVRDTEVDIFYSVSLLSNELKGININGKEDEDLFKLAGNLDKSPLSKSDISVGPIVDFLGSFYELRQKFAEAGINYKTEEDNLLFEDEVIFIDGSLKTKQIKNISSSIIVIREDFHITGTIDIENSLFIIYNEGQQEEVFKASGVTSFRGFEPDPDKISEFIQTEEGLKLIETRWQGVSRE